MGWICFFLIYSYLGCLLEAVYTAVRRVPRRKCLLVLPLCPVYGLGACLCLALFPLVGGGPALQFLIGAAACTAVEYAAAVWYERGLGVSLWNYDGYAGNLRGRVCPVFSMAWGALSLAAARWVQPAAAEIAAGMPDEAAVLSAVLAAADMTVSGLLLRRTGDPDCLDWFGRLFPKVPVPTAEERRA